MKILAIDTSSANCSVAVVEADNNKFNILSEKNNLDEKTHSQKLMPLVSNIFEELLMSLDDIDLISCCIGPGSFTGIRIGIATCKAFVDSKNILATGVSSLESLAYSVADSGYIVSLIDCKNQNVYGSLYYNENGCYSKVTEFLADSISNVLADFSNKILNNSKVTFVGNASELYKDLIIEKFSERAAFCSNNTQSAVFLAKCAYNNFLDNKTGDSSVLSPLYLRASQAERALKEKE